MLHRHNTLQCWNTPARYAITHFHFKHCRCVVWRISSWIVLLQSRVYTGPAFGSSGGIIPSCVRTITGRPRIERLHTHVKLFAVPSAIYGMGLKQLRYMPYITRAIVVWSPRQHPHTSLCSWLGQGTCSNQNYERLLTATLCLIKAATLLLLALSLS